MLKNLIDNYINILDQLFLNYQKEINQQPVSLILSGGIDSSIISYFINKHFSKNKKIFFTLGKKGSDDFFYSQKIIQQFKIELQLIDLDCLPVDKTKEKIISLLKKNHLETNSINLSLATGFYFLFEKIKKQGIKIVFTGQGPDILLAGYHKYKNLPLKKLNQQIKDDLKLLEIDIKRDQAMADFFQLKLINPYLEKQFIDFCLNLPPEYKINKLDNQVYEKYLSRKVGETIGLPKEILLRHKKAFQYSTKIIKLI